MSYRPTIGLEVHAELSTRTKMFCTSKNDPDETRPNANVCPVCMAHPGTLPVPNKEAIRHVIRMGTAIGGRIADFAEFDRKSYFYPDIPKGYQISQYEHPLVEGGTLAEVAITRIHLEEDTARSTHAGGESLVDFNRAGIPLMELVTEPVIHDAATAGNFARELQLLLRTLGASHANLEKGEMRIEANISVSKSDQFGTKVEVKNLNSFRSVERAIAFEIDRQSKVLDAGGTIAQETRGWDETKGETFSQRVKEGSADYRYFPEPDIPKMLLSEVSEFTPQAIRATLPELPWEKRTRYESFGIPESTVSSIVASQTLAPIFDATVITLAQNPAAITLAANYLDSDVAGIISKNPSAQEKLSSDTFATLMQMITSGVLSSRGAKEVLAIMLTEGGEPHVIAKERGFEQVNDLAGLQSIVDEVLVAEAPVVAEYRAGKEAAIMYLVGKAMKASKGAGNPQVLKELIEKTAKQ